MIAPRNFGVGFDARARTRQSKFQMDALTLDDDSHPLKSQSAFGQVEEDTSVFWTELGVVKHSTAPSRTRSALSFPQLVGDAWDRKHKRLSRGFGRITNE